MDVLFTGYEIYHDQTWNRCLDEGNEGTLAALRRGSTVLHATNAVALPVGSKDNAAHFQHSFAASARLPFGP